MFTDGHVERARIGRPRWKPSDAAGEGNRLTITPPPANLLGPAGAWLAAGLYDALGLAVHFLLASWFVLVVLLFLRRSLLTWTLRLAGWLLLLPCAMPSAFRRLRTVFTGSARA